MPLNWFILYLNDPRKLKYINSALYSVGVKGTIWTPTQRDLTAKEPTFKPLFPGYVFIGVDPKHGDIEGLLRESALGAFLKEPGAEHSATLTEEQMNHLRALELEYRKEPEQEAPPAFAIGQAVEVKHGPFAGTPARVLDIKKDKVLVEMCIFQRIVSAQVNVSACRVIDA